jgi:hypothetical protein
MTADSNLLYIWLEGEPGVTPANLTIEDVPGESDLDLVARAIADGRLGRYLPVNLKFAEHPEPTQRRTRSVDVARLLRTHDIRHRRRYEILMEQDA